jgi:PAS domain S-box-containing protein
MKKVKVLRHSNRASDINKHPTTTFDVSKKLVPFRTVRNIRRGHLIEAMRNINHIEWESWEQDVAETQRSVEQQTLVGNNRFYNALERAQALLSQVQKREQELQVFNEEMEASNEELQATNEEMEATNEEMAATNEELEATSEELRMAGVYSRSLVEANLDALVTIGADGKINDVNSETKRITGRTREELIGTDFSDYFTDPDNAGVGYGKAFKEGEVRDYPLELRHVDGHVTPVLYNASVFRDEAGKVRGVLAAARDVTASRRTEDESRRKSEELIRSNTELQNFAYGVSHDLKEPLRVVNSYVQQLAESYQGRLDTEADELIRHVKDGTDKMRGFIDGLLAYAGVGTEPEDFEPVDCDAISEQARLNLEVAIKESGAKITHDPLPPVLADRIELGQIFQNLIANAIKFRGKKPPRIHISGERIEDSAIRIPKSKIQNPCLFSVKDNGIGIEPEGLGRIFQIFERGHKKGEYAGSGIGLALCKKIVDRHGGKIWVESTPGEGSIFYFTMPCGEGGNGVME